jgi:hypothetical protein
VTSRDFCYWLQGFFEVAEPDQLDKQQTASIRKHLALVFKHEIDPSHGPPEHQAELNKIHDGKKPKLTPGSGSSFDKIYRC